MIQLELPLVAIPVYVALAGMGQLEPSPVVMPVYVAPEGTGQMHLPPAATLACTVGVGAGR